MADPPDPPPQITHRAGAVEARPVLVFDGECGFCRRWVARWRSSTGERVEYAAYQDVSGRFGQLSLEDVQRSVQLIEPDDRVSRGAEAIFRTLTHGPGRRRRARALRWAYERLPGMAPVAEWAYRFVARRRVGFSRLSDLLVGPEIGPASFLLSRAVFLRLIGLVYLIAFVSLWSQVHGLIGSNGILPAVDFLEAAREQLGAHCYWRVPTLCWLGGGDAMLSGLCAAGTVLSVLLIVGVAPLAALGGLWVLYLSLTGVGQTFLAFQWDSLLLEAGFLAMFLAPWRLWQWPWRARVPGGAGAPGAPGAAGLWLVRWLLFKLMFLSGITKLLSGDTTWRDLTALDYHYETQPIPTWTSWYVHQLPGWFQKMSVAGMFVIECAVPFLIFAPRRLRHLACGGLVFFQLSIAATGNYCFFNLLSLSLCVLLLDDRLLRRFVPGRWRGVLEVSPATESRSGWRRDVVVALASVLFLVSGLTLVREMVRSQRPVVGVLKAADVCLLSWGQPYVLRFTDPFRTISGYGLFRVMTTERPEIIIEGTNDGRRWAEYEFTFKAGELRRRPRFVAPHQPRLDWQMWFAALSPRRAAHWLDGLLRRLLEGSPEVLDLLAKDGNPFPDAPPEYIRLVSYRYHFTDSPTKRQTGAWWRRDQRNVLTRPLSLRMFERSEQRE